MYLKVLNCGLIVGKDLNEWDLIKTGIRRQENSSPMK
jgi:hypothetical protein